MNFLWEFFIRGSAPICRFFKNQPRKNVFSGLSAFSALASACKRKSARWLPSACKRLQALGSQLRFVAT